MSRAKIIDAVAPACPRALQLHMGLRDDAFLGAVKELDAIPLDGCPFLDETVFFHRPTGSLIGADVVISACAPDHWSWRWAARLKGCHDKVRTPPDVRAKTTPNDAAARSIDRMAALPLKRLLVAHSDAIEDRPSQKVLCHGADPDAPIRAPTTSRRPQHHHLHRHRQSQIES